MPRTRNTRTHRGSPQPANRPLQDITHRFVGEETSAARNQLRKPSPLPPSSPPSVSSQLQYVDSDFNSNELVLKTRVGSSPQSNGSDPFGFFAVERKLKSRRINAPAPRKALKRAPLKVTHVEHDHYPVAPSTPKKQRIRPRESGALPLSEAFEDRPFPAFEFGADPGTPSPSKPRPRPDKGKAKAGPMEPEDDAPVTSPTKEPVLRRSTRRKSETVKIVKSEAKASPPKRKIRSTSSRPKKPATKKKSVKPKQIKEDPDVKERIARERQERIEYFKRLDNYEVAKENIYIV